MLSQSDSFLGKTITQPEEDSKVVSFDNLQNDFIALIRQVFPDPAEAPDLLVSLESSHQTYLTFSSSLVIPWERPL
jgi:hypothetical protein